MASSLTVQDPRNRWSETLKPSVLGCEFQQHRGKSHKDRLPSPRAVCLGIFPWQGWNQVEPGECVGEEFVMHEAAHAHRQGLLAASQEPVSAASQESWSSSEPSVTVKYGPTEGVSYVITLQRCGKNSHHFIELAIYS